MSRCGSERQAATAVLSLLQVLANPSTSDVVATTSCEALAMGKWVPCFRKCIVALTPHVHSMLSGGVQVGCLRPTPFQQVLFHFCQLFDILQPRGVLPTAAPC